MSKTKTKTKTETKAETETKDKTKAKTMEQLSKQRLSLRDTILSVYNELYPNRTDGDGTIEDHIFIDQYIERLKPVCKSLGVPLDSFKNDKNRYEIPLFIAELFMTFMKLDGKKGSTISKLKTGNLDEIGYDNILEVLREFTASFKKKYGNIKGAKVEIAEYVLHVNNAAQHIERKEKTKAEIIKFVQYYLDTRVEKALLQEHSLISLITPSISYKASEDLEKRLKQDIKLPLASGPDWIVYNDGEREALLDQLLTYIKKAFSSWEQLLLLYFETRDCDDNVKKYSIEELIEKAKQYQQEDIKSRYEDKPIPDEEIAAVESLLRERGLIK